MSTPQSYGASLPVRLNSPLTQWAEALASFGRTLRVALPGTVVSFNAAAQTVVVQPAITENERVRQGGGTVAPQPLPPLVDVPVLLPRAGGFTLTMPIQPGDECLVVFGDCCSDAWWQSGSANGPQNQFETRRHSLADGFAIVGIWNQTRVLSSYSTDSAQLRSDDGTVKIDVAASAVTVSAPTVTVTGSQHVNITGAGNTTIEGRNFLNHTHSGVASGGSTSGPVI